LVDEVQDLPENIINDIKAKGSRVIVAGDTNQSIYDDGCQSEQISTILSSQTVALQVIHRISRRIRQVAQFFCSDRKGFNSASLGRLVELPPRLVKAESYDEECKWLILSAKEYAQSGYSPAILIPRHIKIFEFLQNLLIIENKPLMPAEYATNTRDNYHQINRHLSTNGVKFQYLGNGAGSFERGVTDSLVTVMTYHSAKGLDFKAVYVPFLTSSLEIWREPESRARALFFVAITRSREQLFLSYHGNNKHSYLGLIPEADFHPLIAGSEISRMNHPLIADDDDPLVVF
jgi:hypothetical protein